MADPIQYRVVRQGVEMWNKYAFVVDQIDLSGAYVAALGLQGVNLVRANLMGAIMRHTDLRGANLVRANLSGADLLRANLRGADLMRANLRGTQLFEADLSDATLWGADCRTVVTDEGARVSTDLSAAIGLTQEQLDEMTGDRGVIIPAHLTYPKRWPELPGVAAVPAYREEPFVFISYAHANKAEVVEIVRYLRAHNINIWWDGEIVTGDKWRD